MKKKTLVMVMASFCTSPLYAAAFDRTGQSISAFLQPGNYFEASLSVSDTSLEGQE
ncbi:long-chain fatty acid transporter, partial [Acinetobacter baumannii]